MAKVKNETKLIVALLKEKAKAQKEFSARNAKVLGSEEVKQNVHYEKGINWALETLDKIIAETDQPPW